jgi:hypothetical protein
MLKKKPISRRGFSIIEIVVAAAASIIVIIALGTVLAEGQRSWNRMYDRTFSDVVTDSYVARNRFDAVIRKASRERLLLDDAGSWIEVYYYADDSSTAVDRYARFYVAGGDLNVEYGKLDPTETLSTQTVCSNVSSCVFKATGRSVQMILILDNGSQTATITSSAVMHNE